MFFVVIDLLCNLYLSVELWSTLEIMYDVNHGHWHFAFGIKVEQPDSYFSSASTIM